MADSETAEASQGKGALSQSSCPGHTQSPALLGSQYSEGLENHRAAPRKHPHSYTHGCFPFPERSARSRQNHQEQSHS